MTKKSDAYLVSATTLAEGKQETSYDNRGYTSEGQKVAYSPDNGVDVSETKSYPLRPYRGMGKEDLLHFSSQPFWSRLRMICISIIVIGWFALIVTVVALVLVYPKCRDAPGRSWWQTQAAYRVYVPSFKDSNDDGIGDLKGIESKLDVIKGLGFGTISLSPFYKSVDTEGSPITGFGTGNDMAITDHMAVGGVYGTMADFDSLIAEANERDMFVVVDFIPNLTSDQHPWFQASKNSTSNEKRNYYVWQSGTTEPNNWRSMYNGSAWSKPVTIGARTEYYLHQFRPDTPDLNLRSAQVQEELEAIMKFWLDHGVSGFNVRDASYMYEDYDLRDEPGSGTEYSDFDHIYTTNQPEVYSILSRWRSFLRGYTNTTTEKLLMSGLAGDLNVMSLYGDCAQTGVQMPLNTELAAINGTCDAACVAAYVDGWMNMMPSGRWPNWVTGDEDTPRLADRFSAGFISAFTITTMLLPGTPVSYYGDEIGMKSVMADSTDTWSRDRSMRSIMLWSNTTDAGFCNTTCTNGPWTNNIGNPSDGNIETGTSLGALLSELAELRAEPSFRIGDYSVAVRDSSILSFVREFDGETGYLVAINFGPNEETRDFTGSHDTIQTDAVVSFVYGGSYEKEDDVDTSSMKIPPYGGVVVSWDYVADEL